MKITSLILSALLVASPGALAQSKKGHHGDPQHGGVVEELATVHLELTANGKALTLHVYGHDFKHVDIAGAKAQATVFSGKDKATVDFASFATGVMKGEAPFAVRPDAKVVLSFTPAGGKPEQARFQLGAKPDHKGHKH